MTLRFWYLLVQVFLAVHPQCQCKGKKALCQTKHTFYYVHHAFRANIGSKSRPGATTV